MSPTRLRQIQTANVIRYAANLLADGWVKGAMANDGEGRDVDYRKPNAVRFCASGAICRAGFDNVGNPLGRLVRNAENQIKAFTGYGSVISFNDDANRQADEVLMTFAFVEQGLKAGIKFA